MSARSKRFRKRKGGGLVLSLEPPEAELLASLPAELREVFELPLDDPAARRLFPAAYLDPTEEQAEQEWTALVHPDLMRQRLDALEAVARTLERARAVGERLEVDLTDEEVQSWLGVLNDIRLVLGTRLGITDDNSEVAVDGPRAGAYAVYSWLTYLQGDLVDQLLG